MKVYSIQFKQCGYDEYDEFIVYADNKKEVEKIVRKEHPQFQYGDVDWEHGFEIKVVRKKKGIILGSFNAG